MTDAGFAVLYFFVFRNLLSRGVGAPSPILAVSIAFCNSADPCASFMEGVSFYCSLLAYSSVLLYAMFADASGTLALLGIRMVSIFCCLFDVGKYL